MYKQFKLFGIENIFQFVPHWRHFSVGINVTFKKDEFHFSLCLGLITLSIMLLDYDEYVKTEEK